MASVKSFAIEVVFLTGRYVATYHNQRQRGEWPPHPARLFSALVAAWAEDGQDPEERAALEWLEALAPPGIAASDAVHRTVATHYVPVNDSAIVGRSLQERKARAIRKLEDQLEDELVSAGGEITRKVSRLQDRLAKERNVTTQIERIGNTNEATARAMLPEHRGKQERTFPSFTPEEPRVAYVWTDAAPDSIGETLDGLLGRVARLGHSSSLVSCRVMPEPPEPNHVPGEYGDSMRAVRRGQLAELERRYAFHGGVKPRSLPYTDVRYAREARPTQPDETTPNTAGEWLVFEFSYRNRAFPSTRTVDLATAMRGAILHHAEEPIPPELTGHDADGRPVSKPHAAFLPLPYVGFEHADGRVIGVAVSVPGSLSAEARRALYVAVGKWEKEAGGGDYPLRLTLGRDGVAWMGRLRGDAERVTLRPNTWRRPSRRWVSATPVALPRHPGRLTGGTAEARARAWALAEAAVEASCEHVGLPAPAAVEVSLSPFVTGARHARDFPAFGQPGRDGRPVRRQLVHAALEFEHPVSGPLMLGAGRFLGLGLMRPMPEPKEEAEGDSDE